jgi:hypothetical protein
MTSSAKHGWLRRTWTAVKRGLLGKSSREYMKQFTGSDEYFDEAIAAQRGWPQQHSSKPDSVQERSHYEKRGNDETD